MYYFCRFKGYMLVVYTNTKQEALRRLIGYVRETKGNLGYSEQDICKEAKINKVDMIDDTGLLTGLSNLSEEMKQLKREYSNKVNEKIRQVDRLRHKLREFSEEIGLVEEIDPDDYW